jgi:hypothetical protein
MLSFELLFDRFSRYCDSPIVVVNGIIVTLSPAYLRYYSSSLTLRLYAVISKSSVLGQPLCVLPKFVVVSVWLLEVLQIAGRKNMNKGTSTLKDCLQ